MAGFAVVDFETTGFNSRGSDRVVEVAVVHVDRRGNVTGKWQTVLNPERDLGPQHIHGIRGADAMLAPRFADIVDSLTELLEGRIFVAHNASFDLGFLEAEYSRLGRQLPVAGSLCTMILAKRYLPGSGRALRDCCDAFDIPLENAHAALVDATATATLLSNYIAMSPETDWERMHREVPDPIVRDRSPNGMERWRPRSEDTQKLTAHDFLSQIADGLPEYTGSQQHDEYLAVLDRALMDRLLSATEVRELAEIANSLGLRRSTVEELHRAYFTQVARVAWSDRELTPEEKADLDLVGGLLQINALEQTKILHTEQVLAESIMLERNPAETVVSNSVSLDGASNRYGLTPGDLVVLTGEMSRPRSEIEADLVRAGYTPWNGVTKKVKLLITADPDSLSGKTKKAREYGIPVVVESALLELLGK
ncbi:exonuclease domain-containing protein [Timonella senegalensis]|uniref:exonuclease domain-containing protein n=1 Tax=Timonella senegalensis TaxID=1465825 RepID=UPI002FDCD9E7